MEQELKEKIGKFVAGLKNDSMLEMAIQQGYVPKECQLASGLVMALVNSGKNPCDGCNVGIVNNCRRSQDSP